MSFLVRALAMACTALPLLAFAEGPTTDAGAPATPTTTATRAVSADTVAEREPSASYWRFMASPYTYHYSRDGNHRPVWMVGVERQRSDNFLAGAVYFSNSFGQPSGFVYLGQRLHEFSAYPQLFAQWSAGVMYGYKGEYKDKVPFNYGGFSPGVVLALGWQFTPQYSVQANVLGNSALMLQFSVDLK